MPTSSTPLVLVSGSGRSGTSSLAGTLKRLGLHVPQPEVEASETNPRGFYEPQWVIDFHKRHLKELALFNIDSRPAAVDIVARATSSRARRPPSCTSGSRPARRGAPAGRADRREGPARLLVRPGVGGRQRRGRRRPPLADRAAPPRRGRRLARHRLPLQPVRRPAADQGDLQRRRLGARCAAHREGRPRLKRSFVRYVDLLADWRTALVPVQQQLELDLAADLCPRASASTTRSTTSSSRRCASPSSPGTTSAPPTGCGTWPRRSGSCSAR